MDGDTQVLINKQTDFKDTYIRYRKLLVHIYIYTCIDLDIHRYNNNIYAIQKPTILLLFCTRVYKYDHFGSSK